MRPRLTRIRSCEPLDATQTGCAIAASACIDMGNRFQRCREGLEQLVLQLGVKVVRQAAAQFGFDLKMRLARRAAEEAIEYLFGRDRVAVAGQDLGMRAA